MDPKDPSGRAFCDLVISSVGTHPSLPLGKLKTLITKTGAKFQAAVGSSCTHLVATSEAVDNLATKYTKAIVIPGCFVVSLDWLLDSCAAGVPQSEGNYILGTRRQWVKASSDDRDDKSQVQSQGSSTQTAPADNAPLNTRVTRVSARIATANAKPVYTEDAITSESSAAAPKPTKTGKKRVMKQEDPENSNDSCNDQDTKKQKNSEAQDFQKASADLIIPVSPAFFSAVRVIKSPVVYIDSDSLIWDAALNQTSAANNNNKFYCLQLLFDKKANRYYTFTNWGRVGEAGASSLLGEGNLTSAKMVFERKFKDKAGLEWANRLDPPKKGKYTFIERDYEQDEEKADEAKKEKNGVKEEIKDEPVEPSTLDQPIQNLMSFIFNHDYFQSALASMNYDAQKLPLGKLSQRTLLNGFSCLKELSELIDNPELAVANHGLSFGQATELLSNRFFTLIPHVFGRNRPPVLASHNQIKKEVELLENLTDMELSNEIMKDSKKDNANACDLQFRSLGMEEMTTLDHDSLEFQQLENYLIESAGQTHNLNYQILEIFRIQRKGEEDRFRESPYANIESSDRRLLWHGSRSTNFGGILSQGLRIAPPEAPVNGYMFGKGVYLADASSKSAGYCGTYQSGGRGLLLLCEAELGAPMLELYQSNYNAGDDARSEQKIATHGMGRSTPGGWKGAECINSSLGGVKIPDLAKGLANDSQANLMYNEYIVYDVAQIRQRYLFYVKMH